MPILLPLARTLSPLGVSYPSLGEDYAAFVASLDPVLWYRKRETSGSVVVNDGSLGNAQDGTNVNATIAQTGQLGANEAYAYNGSDSIVTIASGSYSNFTAWTWAVLVNRTNKGEGSSGSFVHYGNRGNDRFGFSSVGANSVEGRRSFSGANAVSIAPSAFMLGTGEWMWFFYTFSTADNTIRIYRGSGGAVTQPGAYISQTAGTGTLTNFSASLILGNQANNSASAFNGLYDEAIYFDAILTSDEMLDITTLSGL